MTAITGSSSSSLPIPSISVAVEKTLLTALATFTFCTLQQKMSVRSSLLWSAGCGLLTLASERYVRTSKERWSNLDLPVRCTANLVSVIGIRTLGLYGVMKYFSLPPFFGHPMYLLFFLRNPVLAIVIGPVVEEILCRGFFLERIEDICALFSRHGFEITKVRQRQIANGTQAILFALAHWDTQKHKIVLVSHAIFAYGAGEAKGLNRGGLLMPSLLHSANNLSVYGLLHALF